MAVGTLVLRLVVGGLFVGHGLQKLTGAFEGPGIEGTTGMMDSLDMKPARSNAYAAALSETLGGAGIALGAATPLATTAVTAAMATAVHKVHLKNGLWNAKGGYEFNAALVAAALAVTADGPGRLSVDALFGRRMWGFGWAVFSVVAGVAASAAAITLGRRAAEAERAVAPLAPAHPVGSEPADPDDAATGSTA
ncbi:DoxX family protein [Cnuibacter physcomitrellae]|uniref:DoxX family protein n=1 Tax=Cnuibacter physcomitrellae TaxID=1619308 RepID=UPI002175E701|nr:DoxX family protein [Cnuibacter physcomitrellae]MCS5495791.1 DoxX family protein [Cnuibacter physcomitrellae]